MKITAKILLVCLAVFVGSALPAGGSARRSGGHRGGWDSRHRDSDGLYLAASIVNLVGASLDIIRPQTVVVQPTTTYVTTTQCYPMPVQTYVQPVQTYVQPIVVSQYTPIVPMPYPAPRPYYRDWRGGGNPHGRFRPVSPPRRRGR